jgi:hypothetical protein
MERKLLIGLGANNQIPQFVIHRLHSFLVVINHLSDSRDRRWFSCRTAKYLSCRICQIKQGIQATLSQVCHECSSAMFFGYQVKRLF